MSKVKRVKSHNAGGKRDTAVQNASKKKRKTDPRAIKFKNAELKANLDNQAHLLYGPITTITNATLKPLSLVESNVHDLSAVLSNL